MGAESLSKEIPHATYGPTSAIFQYISENPSVSKSQILEGANVSSREFDMSIDILDDHGFVRGGYTSRGSKYVYVYKKDIGLPLEKVNEILRRRLSN